MPLLVLEDGKERRVFEVRELPEKLREAGVYDLEPDGTVTHVRLFGDTNHTVDEFRGGKHVGNSFITCHQIGPFQYVRIVTSAIFERNRNNFLACYLSGRWVELRQVDQRQIRQRVVQYRVCVASASPVRRAAAVVRPALLPIAKLRTTPHRF